MLQFYFFLNHVLRKTKRTLEKELLENRFINATMSYTTSYNDLLHPSQYLWYIPISFMSKLSLKHLQYQQKLTFPLSPNDPPKNLHKFCFYSLCHLGLAIRVAMSGSDPTRLRPDMIMLDTTRLIKHVEPPNPNTTRSING